MAWWLNGNGDEHPPRPAPERRAPRKADWLRLAIHILNAGALLCGFLWWMYRGAASIEVAVTKRDTEITGALTLLTEKVEAADGRVTELKRDVTTAIAEIRRSLDHKADRVPTYQEMQSNERGLLGGAPQPETVIAPPHGGRVGGNR